jgi:hypothetical protein
MLQMIQKRKKELPHWPEISVLTGISRQMQQLLFSDKTS